MEAMVKLAPGCWQDTPVFLTGHTGFKGAWLALWLDHLGAQVHGYALDPPTHPNLFEVAQIAQKLQSDIRADLRDFEDVQQAMVAVQPRIVFHLAAQPLVRESYLNPLETFRTNILGTAHLLEAVRKVNSVAAVVVVTTDKVYQNQEWPYPYRESDSLGGYDPYSASKASAEMVVASYRDSFFRTNSGPLVSVATVRAGNVIGGGDWAKDRLVPDCLEAFAHERSVSLRFPQAIRPWQHVLEPLSGYLLLGERLLGQRLLDQQSLQDCTAWNFGPDAKGEATVWQVAQTLAYLWGRGAQVTVDANPSHPHETEVLRLDMTRARRQLQWQPRWSVEQALKATVEWYQAWLAGKSMDVYSLDQIQAYEEAMVDPWQVECL
jgi:CDP-glucose 4,6-dehydratase